MAISNARRWAGAEKLLHSQLNAFVNRPLEERAGRHGVVELEDSLSILDGDDGDRYCQFPSGTTAQRPSDPFDGMTRFNTTTSRFEYYTEVAWRDLETDIALVSFANFQANGAVGTGNDNVALGNHTHPDFTVSAISASRTRIYSGDSIDLSVTTREYKGRNLTIRWSAPAGSFSSSRSASTKWAAPSGQQSGVTQTISCRVSDGIRTITRTVDVTYGARTPGRVTVSDRTVNLLETDTSDTDFGDTIGYTWTVTWGQATAGRDPLSHYEVELSFNRSGTRGVSTLRRSLNNREYRLSRTFLRSGFLQVNVRVRAVNSAGVKGPFSNTVSELW